MTPPNAPSPSQADTAAAPPSPPSGRQLADLLRRQLKLYLQLRSLSDEQRATLEEGSTQSLLAVLARRQTVVDELTEVASRVASAGGQWARLTSELPESERASLRGVLDEVQGLAETVLRRDDEDQAVLRGMRQRVGGQLRGLHQGAAAAHAYRGGNAAVTVSPRPDAPRFADRSA